MVTAFVPRNETKETRPMVTAAERDPWSQPSARSAGVHRHACVACMGLLDRVLSRCSKGETERERERQRERSLETERKTDR
jgi:hypothetical protein